MNSNEIVNRVKGLGLCNPPTLVNTYELSKTCCEKKIEGDFVECGVFAGVQTAIMAYVYQNMKTVKRKIHLFDSFEGIPKAGPKDDRTITDLVGEGNGELVTTNISACSMEQVQSYMKQWQIDPTNLIYHKGWFQNTVSDCGIDKIALLRLDGDLYESTKVCMEHLFPKLQVGGFLIVDDYALTGCRLAIHEYLDSVGVEPQFIKVDGGGGPVWMQKP